MCKMVSEGSVRWLVRMMIPELYESFKSANKALKFLRSVGLGYRRKDFLTDWREILDLEKKRDEWKYVRYEYKINEELHVATTFYTSTKYTYFVESVFTSVTGETRTKRVAVTSDSVLSKKEIFERVEPLFMGYGVEEQLGILVSMNLVGAYRRLE